MHQESGLASLQASSVLDLNYNNRLSISPLDGPHCGSTVEPSLVTPTFFHALDSEEISHKQISSLHFICTVFVLVLFCPLTEGFTLKNHVVLLCHIK